jgi:hypothetical protein
MILESNLLAKLQVGEKMLSHGLNTLHFDGTTDAQKHFLGFQISTPGQNLSLSISETIRGDTQTQVDTLKQVFNDLSDVMSSDSTEENKDKIYANHIICTITHISQHMEMTEILVYLRGPLFLIFRQITPVSVKLFKKESSQFSELVEKVFVDNMLIGH